jgi:tRNA(Arg) A34 adenosine deaminase TadA
MIKNILLVCLSAVVVMLLIIASSTFYKLKGDRDLDPELKNVLVTEAVKPLEHLDVPVAAIIVYKDEIIGKGYNDENHLSNIAGHAEINAINDMLTKTGKRGLSLLDRNSLALYSTFEPCRMCEGAILNAGIRKVYFLKEKSFKYMLREGKLYLDQSLKKTQLNGSALQDSLFRLHPSYPKD